MAAYNLPQHTTAFVGRTAELDHIAMRLVDSNCRLLTLVGPGGIGKTRLAIEVATHPALKFASGAYFVDLQPVASADNFLAATAHALGVEFSDDGHQLAQLIDYLHDKQMLLILDNFEHLLPAAQQVAAIVSGTSQLKLLVTSREALNLRDEWLFHVDGMRYPHDEHIDPLDSFSAVNLFIACAQRVRHDFSPVDESANVVRICQLVDGAPLGIELAATWLKRLPCSQIVEEIERSFDFLETDLHGVPDRHRSMRAVFDHSWQLLSEEEHSVLMRSAVFHGGFLREAAEQVAGASLHTLSALVDKSLLRVNQSGRYEVHELVRQFAEEQLIAAGISENVCDNHCDYYLHFLHEREADLKGRRQLAATDEIEADFNNVRVAWQRAIDQRDYDLIDCSINCLRHFCIIRNRWQDARMLMQAARDGLKPRMGEDPHPVWGRALTNLGGFQNRLVVPFTERARQVEQGLAIARLHGDVAEEAYSLLALTSIHAYEGNPEKTKAYGEQSLALYRSLDDEFFIGVVLFYLSFYYRHAGQPEEGIALLKQSRDLAQKMGDKNKLAHALSHLGNVTNNSTGDYLEAERYWQESSVLRHALGAPNGVAICATALSEAAILRGDNERARLLANEALEVGSKVKGGWDEHIFYAQRTFAKLALCEEDYEQARLLFDESRKADTIRPFSATDLWLALVCCGLRDYHSATNHLCVALNSIEANCALPFLTQFLPPAAIIVAHDGQPEWATHLLGLAFTYPGTRVGMMATWSQIDRFVTELEAELGADAFHAAWEHGASLDLQMTIASLMSHFDIEREASASPAANRVLIEPLSERELEVLRLIAEGLSNREIARELIVTVGTVKKHNNNIFGKLDVGSRTQAVARAKALNLLT